MKSFATLLRVLLFVLALAAAWVSPGMAQNTFPSKPVHIIVPVMGGTMDLLASLLSLNFSAARRQSVIAKF